jgi:hypothetical protein
MMKRSLAMCCLLIALTAGVAWAAPGAAAAEPHPDVAGNPVWVKGVLIGILLLFAFAIPVGIIIRANMPDEPPPEHSHDEHGDDPGHGAAAHGHH